MKFLVPQISIIQFVSKIEKYKYQINSNYNIISTLPSIYSISHTTAFYRHFLCHYCMQKHIHAHKKYTNHIKKYIGYSHKNQVNYVAIICKKTPISTHLNNSLLRFKAHKARILSIWLMLY